MRIALLVIWIIVITIPKLDADTKGIREGWYILYKTSHVMAFADNIPRVLGEQQAAKLDNDTYEYVKAEKDKLGVYGFRKVWADDEGNIRNTSDLLIQDGKELVIFDNALKGTRHNTFSIVPTQEGFNIVWLSRLKSIDKDKYDSWAGGAIWHYRYWAPIK